MRGGEVIRNEDDGSPAGWPIEAMHANPAIFGHRDAEATVEGRRQVVAVSLKGKAKLQDALRGDAKAAQLRAEPDAGHDRGRAAAQATPDRDLIADAKRKSLEGGTPSGKGLLR